MLIHSGHLGWLTFLVALHSWLRIKVILPDLLFVPLNFSKSLHRVVEQDDLKYLCRVNARKQQIQQRNRLRIYLFEVAVLFDHYLLYLLKHFRTIHGNQSELLYPDQPILLLQVSWTAALKPTHFPETVPEIVVDAVPLIFLFEQGGSLLPIDAVVFTRVRQR